MGKLQKNRAEPREENHTKKTAAVQPFQMYTRRSRGPDQKLGVTTKHRREDLTMLMPLLLFFTTVCSMYAQSNETSLENANPGTTNWQITSPALNREIE